MKLEAEVSKYYTLDIGTQELKIGRYESCQNLQLGWKGSLIKYLPFLTNMIGQKKENLDTVEPAMKSKKLLGLTWMQRTIQ